MSITPAKVSDLSYIEALSKKHAEELGFLPRAALTAYLERDRVTLAHENGDPCGYFLIGAASRQVRIFQACVQLDARGLAHGKRLLSDLITRSAHAGVELITLHCRDGLASNSFWSACGFQLSAPLLGGSARRKIVNEWSLPITAALSDPTLPYAQHFLRNLRRFEAPSQCQVAGSASP